MANIFLLCRVPFRQTTPSQQTLWGGRERYVTAPSSSGLLDSSTQQRVVSGIRHEKGGRRDVSSLVPTDADLLGSMATRLAMVERELLAAKREITLKVWNVIVHI